MSVTRIAINGFGRIGRQVFKIIWDHYPELQVAAIGVTDLSKTNVQALLLQHDSTYGQFHRPVHAQMTNRTGSIVVDGRQVSVVPRRTPKRSWADYGIDIVIDATGRWKRQPLDGEHLSEGAKKVIVTEPMDFADVTVVYGVNQDVYDPRQHHIISASSCTTTALSPIAKVLDERFGVREGFVTAIHAYTNSQNLLDASHTDPRRARAAGYNIIPTTTGTSDALDKVLPGLGVRVGAAALRVPVPTVSLVDLIVHLEEPATADQVNEAFYQAAAGPLRGILDISDKPLVSADYAGNPHSAVIDALSTAVAGQLVRVAAWYDNEWGYSSRVADLTACVAQFSYERSTQCLEMADEATDGRWLPRQSPEQHVGHLSADTRSNL